MALLQNYDAVYKLSYRNKILYNSKKDLFYQEIPLLLLSFAWPVYRVPGDTRSRTQGQGTQQEEARTNWNALAHRIDRINKTRPSGDLYLWLCLDQWPFQFFWVLNLACAIHSPQPPLVVTGRNMTDLVFSFSQPAFTTTQALALIYVNRFQMCSPQQGHGFHTKAFTLKQTCGPAKPPEPVQSEPSRRLWHTLKMENNCSKCEEWKHEQSFWVWSSGPCRMVRIIKQGDTLLPKRTHIHTHLFNFSSQWKWSYTKEMRIYVWWNATMSLEARPHIRKFWNCSTMM